MSDQDREFCLIVFSKDRPLQLTAYLESLFYYSDIKEHQVKVITPTLDKYNQLQFRYGKIDWIDEGEFGGFDKCLRHMLKEVQEDGRKLVMFGCDDVVFFKKFSINDAKDILNLHDFVFGYSYRLGTNIDARVKSAYQFGRKHVFWEWLGGTSHYGYPFDCMGTVYRLSDLNWMVQQIDQELKTPNYFESSMVNKAVELCPQVSLYFMAMSNDKNCCAAIALNRVQSDFPNKTIGGDEFTAERLEELYDKGFRLDWLKLEGIVHHDCFLQKEHFVLIDTNEKKNEQHRETN